MTIREMISSFGIIARNDISQVPIALLGQLLFLFSANLESLSDRSNGHCWLWFVPTGQDPGKKPPCGLTACKAAMRHHVMSDKTSSCTMLILAFLHAIRTLLHLRRPASQNHLAAAVDRSALSSPKKMTAPSGEVRCSISVSFQR